MSVIQIQLQDSQAVVDADRCKKDEMASVLTHHAVEPMLKGDVVA